MKIDFEVGAEVALIFSPSFQWQWSAISSNLGHTFVANLCRCVDAMMNPPQHSASPDSVDCSRVLFRLRGRIGSLYFYTLSSR